MTEKEIKKLICIEISNALTINCSVIGRKYNYFLTGKAVLKFKKEKCSIPPAIIVEEFFNKRKLKSEVE